jgi:hypothetical protein
MGYSDFTAGLNLQKLFGLEKRKAICSRRQKNLVVYHDRFTYYIVIGVVPVGLG